MNETSRSIRVGIAGYGIVGKRRRQCIDQHPQMTTVAVCDRVLGSEGIFNDGVRYYTNYKRLLSEDLDALFVCMTNDIAAEVTMAGLNKGLHAFCEKPPGQNLEQVGAVLECEKKHPELKLKYGFNHRYHESVKDAIAIKESGKLGEIVDLRAVYGKSKIITATGQNADWRAKRAIAGGGILLDQGIHMVDLLRLFVGDFKDVYSFISNSYWNYDVEDNAYVLLRTADGKVAFLQSSATQWRHDFHLHITFELGSVTLKGILSGTKSYGAETMTVAWKAADESGDPREQTTRYVYDPSWEDEVAVFAEAILSNRPIESGSARDAFETMKLVYRIYCADPEWREMWNLSCEVSGTKSGGNESS